MYWGLLCSVYRIQSNVSTYADERKELINHNGTNDESKPRTPLKDKHYRNITECTIVTITVHFIRPIRDLALCERLAFLFRHIFYSVKKRRISVCSCVCHFVSIVFLIFDRISVSSCGIFLCDRFSSRTFLSMFRSCILHSVF